MTNEELIIRLARELYDLKIKLGVIHKIADKSFEDSRKEEDKDLCIRYLRISLVDVMNEIEIGEVYE